MTSVSAYVFAIYVSVCLSKVDPHIVRSIPVDVIYFFWEAPQHPEECEPVRVVQAIVDIYQDIAVRSNCSRNISGPLAATKFFSDEKSSLRIVVKKLFKSFLSQGLASRTIGSSHSDLLNRDGQSLQGGGYRPVGSNYNKEDHLNLLEHLRRTAPGCAAQTRQSSSYSKSPHDPSPVCLLAS